MKSLIDVKEEVYKCSKCGLCKSVCPIYLATKNELYSPRGRNIILNQFFLTGKKLSKKFINDLDVCLNCNACKEFCPSNINSKKIYSFFKVEHKFCFFSFYFYFKLLLIYFENFVTYFFNNKYKRGSLKNEKKVVYFENSKDLFFNKKDAISAISLIEKLGYEVITIKKLDQIKSLKNDFDFIITSCDHCFDNLSKNDLFNNKLITIDELFKMSNFKVIVHENVVYHKPIFRKSNCYFPQNVQVINRKGSCSLMENLFLLKYPKISDEILKKVFYTKEEINNKIIITSSNLDYIGLKKCIKKLGFNTKVFTYSQYINLLTENE